MVGAMAMDSVAKMDGVDGVEDVAEGPVLPVIHFTEVEVATEHSSDALLSRAPMTDEREIKIIHR